jgi:pimeloyl-ACP methyl ester carboxylesterase
MRGMQLGGALKNWSAEDGAAAVQQPVLLLRGEDEELSEEAFAELQRLLPLPATVARFAGAASYVHIDAWEPYLETLNSFLEQHDKPVTA